MPNYQPQPNIDASLAPEAISPQVEMIAPPQVGMPVSAHFLADCSQPQQLLRIKIGDAWPGFIYKVSAWIFVPSSFSGSAISLVFHSYPGKDIVAADLSRRDCWQLISARTVVPEDRDVLLPKLTADGVPGAKFFTAGWQVVRDDATAKALAPDVLRSSRRKYRIVRIDEIQSFFRTTSGPQRVSIHDSLPDVDVEIPQIMYGNIEEVYGAKQWPKDSWSTTSFKVRDANIYKLRDAVIHGEQGIVTIDDMVVAESLYMAQPTKAGFEFGYERDLIIPNVEPEITIDVASSMLCGYVGSRNYAHWIVDVLPALLVPPFHTAFEATTLIVPELRSRYHHDTYAILPELQGRSLFISGSTKIKCNELRIAPKITKSISDPHPHRLGLVNELKRRVGCAGRANRRIYVSRRDAAARPLLNEEFVERAAQQQGFEVVRLSGFTLSEQINLFSSASHIISPHGAALANVIFCERGAAVLELQMRSNVMWAMRRLAGVVGLRYGCLVGEAIDNEAPLNTRGWEIDLHEFQEVLLNSAFTSEA